MTRERSFDERISAWLRDEAPDQLPDRVFRATFERTRTSRQRRTIIGWRPTSMTRIQAALAVGAAAIVVIAFGAMLLPGMNSVGGRPSPTPTHEATVDPNATLAPISLPGQIAFTRTVEGNADIYLMNLDRTGLVRLTDDPGTDSNPGWSPDGQLIVFTRAGDEPGDLYLMNADGGSQRRLTETPGADDYARFSPDGQTIAYWTGPVDGARSELWLMDADGSNQRLVVGFDDTFATGIGWTADGREILFNRDLSTGGAIDIVRVELDSKVVTQVTTEPGDDSTFAVSNDGSTIAFQSDRVPGGIFLMDVDGTNVRHLTGDWQKGYPLSWSGDGQHIAFRRADGWIYVVPVAGGEAIKWTDGGLDVAWRPGS